MSGDPLLSKTDSCGPSHRPILGQQSSQINRAAAEGARAP